MATSIALGMRLSTATELANATGIEGEISVVENEWRAVVHDGTTKGGHPVAKKSEVEAIQNTLNQIPSTYLTKTDAQNTYLGKTDKAASATTADSATTASSATKANQDANGNVINTTYATVSSVDTVSAAAQAAQTTANNALPKTGGTVAGNLTVTGTLKGATIQSTSDERLKENLEPIGSALARLEAIEAFTYSFKADKSRERHAGVVAQQVQKVLPEAVKKDADGYYSVDYNGVLALALQAINELNQKVKELQNERI